MRSLLLFLCVFSQCAVADVVVLNNGDRITGDVKRIVAGEVFVKPDYSQEFGITIEQVASITIGDASPVAVTASGNYHLDDAENVATDSRERGTS